MTVFTMKLPDVGEGVAEAELVEWLVAVGDAVTPDTVIAEVLTDKATIEVSSPVTGQVVALHGEPGDVLAIGGDLIGIETGQAPASAPAVEPTVATPSPARAPARVPGAATAAPAVRARASDNGIDLATIAGSGPEGRILHADLDRVLRGGDSGSDRRSGETHRASDTGRREAVRGIRRQIAQRLSATWSEIPHITYVDDVDMTELERLRAAMNEESHDRGLRLTILPFLARALVVALSEQPAINAHYDHSAETLTIFDAVHVGVATQTDAGLSVPVVRHVEERGVWDIARELGRVTRAARDGSATRDELTGSTITITSLGALGGVMTTPLINSPEVAIVGVNKMETRPVWRDGAFHPRQMMNLSSSFDHRMVDGWDAATFVGRIKRLLESPALLFVTDD